MKLLEAVGRQVQALGVPEPAQFNAATAIMSFILGLASQHASRAWLFPGDVDRKALRKAVLEAIAARWSKLDATEHPFVRQVATTLADHDDRDQFLAGIDLILAGLESRHEEGPC